MNDENDEYYSVARKNESTEVAGKWLELSIINISEVTHTIKVISGGLLCLFRFFSIFGAKITLFQQTERKPSGR